MRYTIYRTTNSINGKFYIGKHQTLNPNDGYLGSGRALEAAIQKHGREYFNKEVLHDFSSEEEMNAKEKELITEALVKDPQCYNIGIGGEGGPHFKGRKHSEESKAKFSRRGVKLTAEHRQKLSDRNRQRKLSPETKQKISEAAKKRWAKVH